MALIQRGFQAYDGSHAPKWPFTLNKDSPQAQGLVGWWPMFGGQGFRDLSGFGHNGVVTGSPNDVASEFGNIIKDFVRADGDLIDVGDISNVIPIGSAWTVSMWARVALGDVGTDQRCIASWGTNDNALGIWWDTGGIDNWAAVANNSTQNSQKVTNTNVDNALSGVLQLVTVTVTDIGSSGKLSIYVDGIFSNDVGAPSGNNEGFFDLVFGAIVPATALCDAQMFDGRVYNRTLNAAEVWQLYDPSTRWDLYHELGRVAYSFAPGEVVAPPTINLVMAPYTPT